jgi:hypothetical protein
MTDKLPQPDPVPTGTVEGPELRAEIAQRLRRRREEWSAAERSELGRGKLVLIAIAALLIVLLVYTLSGR